MDEYTGHFGKKWNSSSAPVFHNPQCSISRETDCLPHLPVSIRNWWLLKINRHIFSVFNYTYHFRVFAKQPIFCITSIDVSSTWHRHARQIRWKIFNILCFKTLWTIYGFQHLVATNYTSPHPFCFNTAFRQFTKHFLSFISIDPESFI